MATDNILRQYGDSSVREDVVLNAIEYLTAKETQIFNMLPKGTAIAMVHNYLTDTLSTAASLAVEEGSDYTATSLTTPTRLTNIVEIVAYDFKVSRTEQQIAHYTGENELNRQVQKAMWNWANAAEFDLLRGTLTSGASGTAPTMNGIIAATSLANNHTSQTSGTVFNTSIVDSLQANSWTNSNGDVPTDLFMGAWIRQKFDQAIQKSNVVVNTPFSVTDIVRTVSTYQTSFGTLNLRTHRYIQQGGDTTGRILAIRPDKLRVAFLQGGGKPYLDTELARNGDYDQRAVVGKFTLEVHNQNSHYYSDGFSLVS
jgi:hypothetical protein